MTSSLSPVHHQCVHVHATLKPADDVFGGGWLGVFFGEAQLAVWGVGLLPWQAAMVPQPPPAITARGGGESPAKPQQICCSRGLEGRRGGGVPDKSKAQPLPRT